MTNELDTLARQMLPALEDDMRDVLQATAPPADAFYGMIHYHMGWVDAELQAVSGTGGKRIRPLTTLLSCAAAGGDWHQALPAASAVEILHNFSLVHDDIEDASPTRRGRLTVWKLWGEPQAINTGDAMFALAHLAMARLADREVAPSTVVTALRRFDETCLHLTQGQYADMDFETRDVVSVDEYMAMITGKTAVLLSLCAELGGLIAGADGEIVRHYAAFGRDLGLAFQVIDDILGIWGDETKTGKSAATDIVTKKKTLPVLYGLERSPVLQQLYATAAPDKAFVAHVVELLDEVGARSFANEKASYYSESALAHLEAARPTGPASRALYQMADMLLNRDY